MRRFNELPIPLLLYSRNREIDEERRAKNGVERINEFTGRSFNFLFHGQASEIAEFCPPSLSFDSDRPVNRLDDT